MSLAVLSCAAPAEGLNDHIVESVVDVDDHDPDGGPTEILNEPPLMLDKAVTPWTEAKVWRELALSLISLNEKTATTFDFPQSALPDSDSADISCGRADSNAIVLQDPRVSSTHFTIHVRRTAARIPATKAEMKLCGPGLELELEDGSSNGTWVNDKPVGKGNRVPLSTGDRIFVLPSARVGASSIIGYVVVALPFLAEAACATLPSQKENDGGKSGNENPFCGGHEAERQLVSIVQCRLCEDALIHRCVTAVPCGHNFCCGCIIDRCRTQRTPDCPTCKAIIRQLVRNHSVDSIVDTFIHAHPEAARPPESLQRLNTMECDKRNEGIFSRLMNTAYVTRPPPVRMPQPPAQERPAPLAANRWLQQRPAQQQAQQPAPDRRRPSQGGSSACVIS